MVDILVVGLILGICFIGKIWLEIQIEKQKKLNRSKCSKCKTELENDDNYCINCGNERTNEKVIDK